MSWPGDGRPGGQVPVHEPGGPAPVSGQSDQSPSSLTIRALHAGDDLDAELDLRHRAFGPINDGDRDLMLAELRAWIADSRLYGVWDGANLVGAAMFHDLRQWWHGRTLPMAGVGGVKVAPEARGRGVGKALMTALLGVLAERSYPLAVLYPATAHIYRSLGWEFAGGNYRAVVPGRSLVSLLPPDPALGAAPADSGPAEPSALRRAGPADADEVISVLGAVYAGGRDCGPCTFDAASMRHWLADPEIFGYLAADGFLAYGWRGSDHEIMVHVLQAGSARTARALWGIVASHATVTETVHACLGPDDPISWLTREPDVRLRQRHTWMLRVLDAKAAIAGRGFPAVAQIRVPLRLTDPQLPANAGLHTLTVTGGQGYLFPAETGRPSGSESVPPVTLGPRGFAALFAGVPLVTLRRAGLALGGDSAADAALDCAFAARPYLLDYF